jgi:hypothetical protein
VGKQNIAKSQLTKSFFFFNFVILLRWRIIQKTYLAKFGGIQKYESRKS